MPVILASAVWMPLLNRRQAKRTEKEIGTWVNSKE